jgi:hypothetical protein
MKKLLLASLLLATTGAFAQTKKVIIEDYTGLHCGWCPEGTVILEGLRSSNPTNCLPVAIHTGSYEPGTSAINMQSSVGSALTSTLKVLGFPNGAVDRKNYPAAGAGHDSIAMGRGSWSAAFNVQKAKTAVATVSFSNKTLKTDGSYECDVNVVFTSLPTAGIPLTIGVFLVEDSIAASGSLAQDNYSSSVQGGASPLSPWFHNRTLRWSASGDAWGFSGVIPATPVVGTKYTKHITITPVTGISPTGWVTKNMTLVAFTAMNGSAFNDQKEILNAEEVSLKSFFKTGVENTATPVTIYNAFPNPATLNDVVKVEFNMNTTGAVKMNVYNAMGQLVATPFDSYEAAGTHTLQWKASENGLTAGVYIMEVVTAEGKQTQRITLQ